MCDFTFGTSILVVFQLVSLQTHTTKKVPSRKPRPLGFERRLCRDFRSLGSFESELGHSFVEQIHFEQIHFEETGSALTCGVCSCKAIDELTSRPSTVQFLREEYRCSAHCMSIVCVSLISYARVLLVPLLFCRVSSVYSSPFVVWMEEVLHLRISVMTMVPGVSVTL